MKFVLVLALVAAVAARPDGYDTRYDNMNIDEILDNERLLTAYVNCFLGKGKCTPEGNDINKLIPDAVQSSCGKCNEKQKGLAAKMIRGIMNKVPAGWTELSAKYNPDSKFDAELNAFLDKYSH